jgi:hypothetical protein
MMRSQHTLLAGLVLISAIMLGLRADGAPVTGLMQPTTPLGQFLSLRVTIGDTTTRFELTGPDFSFFAFGFDTVTMQGYSLIVQGTGANRTVNEQNLVGVGNPGGPQATQNLDLVSSTHDSVNHLSTLVLERANSTGDSEDPVFSPNMTSLNMIWGYNSYATPDFPYGDIDYHGRDGRGFATLNFAPVPEPTGWVLLSGASAWGLRRRKRNASTLRLILLAANHH